MSWIHRLRHYPQLNSNELQAYRYFNLLLGIGIIDLIVIILGFLQIPTAWPLYFCIAELIFFILLLIGHVKGYFISTRLLFFISATAIQALASLTHGKEHGFDLLFLILAILPMLFFDKWYQYTGLFILSILSMYAVRVAYDYVEPNIPLPEPFPFYWNLFVSSFGLFLVISMFKRGYLKQQNELIEQNNQIKLQKEEIEGMNNNLENIIVDRTNQLLGKEELFSKYAHLNAHKVRSPLARIMGLLHIIDIEQDKVKVMDELWPQIKDNVWELNEVLNEVSQTLNDTRSKEEES
ncbi:hypothetical protein QWY31_00715 [Cytophagales bacterium LB-30]|uniref:Histidine kinase n=1 Tax=Shiella aurantiaca TaxID=3058365 RepID=A0ABT8F137_9BACT|nr:hypothetical protein [Shiella aurantiaca]MDN4163998.1 hypothetical protein [Shiella aurantiaca]